MKQDMVERFTPLFGGLNKYFKIIDNFLLAGEILKRKGA
jgi:hypothetical protein